MGGAGIGIGIGGWGVTERLTVSACTALRNGTNGIFVELRKRTWTPPRGIALAPVRPGATTAWPEGTPHARTPYRLPDVPQARAGITVAAAVHGPTMHDNRTWDSQRRKTQTHGLRITENGSCESGWVHHNDLDGNAVAAARFDAALSGGCWHHNHGLDGCPDGRA